jgi:PAS domain S-box-containing protein
MKGISSLPPVEDTELVLEEVFRNTPIGAILSDLHGTIIDANDAVCAMLGYSHSELVGRSLNELVEGDDQTDVTSRIADLREGRLGQYQVTRRFVGRSGEIIDAKVSASVVRSRQGEAVCGIAFLENITERVAMEAALRRSETLYRRIVEDQTDMIVRCLPDGTRTFVNEAYCRYSNATAESLIGTSFFPSIPESEQQLVREKYAALSPSNPVLTEQHSAITAGGEIRWHEWTDRGFFDEAGRLIEIQAVGRDLTEQHAANERLARSEERYRRLFNSLTIAAWESDWSEMMAGMWRRGIRTPDDLAAALRRSPELFYELASLVRIVGVNPAALAMSGTPDRDSFAAWLRTAWTPESAQRYVQGLLPVIFGDARWLTDELTLIRRDGEPIDVLFRVARSDRWGEEWMMFPVAIDITEAKRAQRELQHRQELTERAEAAAHFGTWEWNRAEDMIYGTAEFWRILVGHDGGDSPQRSMRECLALMHPDDGASAIATWNALRAPSAAPKPAVIDNDYRLRRPDGSIAIARGQSFASYGPDGELIRAFGIMRDITDSQRAEEEAARHRDELIRADKMISLGILVSGMAHEINNPNHSIMLNAPLARAAWREVAELVDELAAARSDLRIGRVPWKTARVEVAGMLDDIEHASERIRTIVKELRGFALDQDPGVRQKVSVNAIVQSSLRLLGNHIGKATRQFDLDLGDVPPVLANAPRIEQVIVNLVINACQALENDRQSIRILTGADGERVFIRVIDEGRGIAAEHLVNIRDPFFTTRRAEGGTGLGLAVSDRIAGEHGGELTFDSGVGRGTTATLWLPIGTSS